MGQDILDIPSKTAPHLNGSHEDGHLDLKELLKVLSLVKNGKLDVRMPVTQTGITGRICEAVNDIIDMNERLVAEISSAKITIGKKGNLSKRIELPDVPLEISGHPLKGEFLRIAKESNQMLSKLRLFSMEVTRVARQVGSEGKLGEQAKIKGVAGVWAEMTDSVNQMATNLTGQIRGIAKVATDLRQQKERLQVINNDLMLLNLDLEQRVLDRTIGLENLNHQLKSLNLSKDQFISVLSHDLRNPFTALLIASGKLSEGSESLTAAQIKQLSQIVNRTANKLVNQLNEVIEWAKKQSKKANFNPEEVHLSMGIEAALELLKPNAAQKKIKLQNRVPKDIFVKADSLMLRSIVQNLVTNAIKYTLQGGSVIINARLDDQRACIFVSDSGVGMAPEMREKLFNEHNGEPILGTNNERGSGLGLMLVNDFVLQHGGTIEVESAIGKGTTFKFTIPAVKGK